MWEKFVVDDDLHDLFSSVVVQMEECCGGRGGIQS